MARKEVILTPQERFDIVDATALQTLTYSYIGEALGGIMGWGAGMLTPLPITYQEDGQSTEVTLGGVFAFYQSTTAAPATTGEVIVYNPQSPAQTTTTIDFAQARAAATVYYFGNDIVPARFTGEGPMGNGGFPLLWARAATLSGGQDARRQWSVASQTEVPVTLNTREQTYVEFQLADALAGPPDDNLGLWAPIAKVVGWADVAGTLTRPQLQEISVWDNLTWFRKTSQAGTDRDGDNALDDFWSQLSSNTAAGQIMSIAGADAPWASRWHSMFSDRVGVAGAGLQQPVFQAADLVSWLRDAGSPLDAGSLYYPQSLAAADALATNPATGTGGIVDVLNAIRAIVKNLACEGIRDYPQGVSTDDHPFAALTYSNRVANTLGTPYGALTAAETANVHAIALASDAKLKLHGDPDAQWHAKPLRSVNALSIEQVVQNETIKKLEADLTAAETAHAALAARVIALEANDPFQNAPFHRIEPLLPLAVVSFRPTYSHASGQMGVRCGPPNIVAGAKFQMLADGYSLTNYASGYVEITLDEALVHQNIVYNDFRYCPIFAQPVHIQGDGGWLTPSGLVYAGGGEDARTFDLNSTEAYETQQKEAAQVLAQFGNFFQCTLNVVIMEGPTPRIRVYPVSTVPDYVGQGKNLRGYPHMHEIMHWYENDVNDGREWHWASTDFGMRWGTGQPGRMIFGDVTNPLAQWRAGFFGNPGGIPASQLPAYVINGVPQANAQNIGFGSSGGGAINDLKDMVWGVRQVGANGAVSTDDMRGGAPRLTYLRPDRYHYGKPEGSGSYDAAQPHLFLNAASRTDPTTHGDESMGAVDGSAGPTTENLRANGQSRCANGRFMPAFHLVVYRPEFTTLGGGEGADSVNHIGPGAGWWVPDGQLPVAGAPNPDVGFYFGVDYHHNARAQSTVGRDYFYDGTSTSDATSAGPGDSGDVSRVHTGATRDQAQED